mgnify:CR=1 FL=1
MNKIFKTLSIIISLILLSIMVISCGNEEVNEIKNLIDNLGEITLDSKLDLENIEEKYNALSSDLQVKVSNYNTYLSKKDKYDNLYQRSIHPGLVLLDKINEIPYPLTFTNEEIASINKIQEEYLALSNEEKVLVTNYSTLESVLEEIRINELKESATTINKLILSLLEESKNNQTITLDEILEQCKQLLEEYNKLNNDVKQYVENYNNLVTLKQETEKLIEDNKINLLKAQAKEVNELIQTLKDDQDYSDNKRSLVNNIIDSYNKLSNDVKKNVVNYDLVLKVKKAIEDYDIEQEKIRIQNKVKGLNEKIAELKDISSIKLSDKDKINDIDKEYQKLTKEEKAYIVNYNYVTKALEQITILSNAKKVIDLINALPSNVTLSDEAKIKECKNAYDVLDDSTKKAIDNFDKLQKAWNALNTLLQGDKPYKVYFNLFGGELSNIKSERDSSIKEVAKINVNYYNKGFWEVYTTQCVMYDKATLLADSGSSYAYNLKIGFSFDSKDNCYKVNQIVSDGTGLSTEARSASEYFIICNSANGADMTSLSSVNVGMIVDINKTIPADAIDNFGATISFTSLVISEDVKYFIEYTGLNTLSTPTLFGKVFAGWYDNPEFNGNPITEVSYSMTLYAKYEREKKIVTTETILNAVSDVVESDTIDELISENDDARFTWSSSNNNLYNISNNEGKTSRYYQTHKKQTAKVTCVINYKTGGSKTVSKDIIINPVKFEDLPSTPVASYYAVGAASSYKAYSDRYKQEQTLFSEKAKQALDIIYYSFITPTSTGECSIYTPSYAPLINELKNYNVRVIASINGVSADTAKVFVDCCKTDALAADFAKRLVDVCEKYNFDGLDIDWEYVSSQPITAASYTRLMKALRNEFAKRQDEGGTPYMLTAAIPSNSWTMDTSRYNFSDLNKYLDYINIMSYDSNKSNVASHLAPHYSSSYDNGYGFGDVYGVNRFSGLGISKSKLLLGCAGYGKAYKVSGEGKNPNYPGLGANATLIQIPEYASKGSYASGTLYGNVVNYLEANSKYKKYIEYNANGQIVGAYLYNATDKIFATYDSVETIAAKFDYAKEVNGMGLMCWAFTEDMSDHYINTCYDCKNK